MWKMMKRIYGEVFMRWKLALKIGCHFHQLGGVLIRMKAGNQEQIKRFRKYCDQNQNREAEYQGHLPLMEVYRTLNGF